MLPFQIGRIIFAVAHFREVVPSCQLRASLYCEQQSSHANARKSRMGLTLFDNCRASVSDSQNRRIPAQWKDLLRCRRCGSYGRANSRTNGIYNDTKVVTIYLSTRQEPLQSVVLEARRAPQDKITQVSVSSPLPKPVVEEE